MAAALALCGSALSGPGNPQRRVELPEGARLRAEPDAGSRSLAILDSPQVLSVVEERDGWTRVLYQSFTGWVFQDGDAEGPAATTRRPQRSETRLARARSFLTTPHGVHPMGGFLLHTDVTDEATLAGLATVAAALPALYAARYGVDVPEPRTPDAVVLYRGPKPYARFADGDALLPTASSRGHAASGVAVLYVSPEGLDETRGVLAHELTHLLSRRALGPRLPAWIEEGLAEDFGMCRFPNGIPAMGSLRSRSEVRSERAAGGAALRTVRTQSGPLVSAAQLASAHRQGTLRSLSSLTSLPYDTLVSDSERATAYPQSALLVRYLLDGGFPDGAPRFREFLRGVAEGDSPSLEQLCSTLRVSPEALEEGFRGWLSKSY